LSAAWFVLRSDLTIVNSERNEDLNSNLMLDTTVLDLLL
jgi:hypothetical protein